MGQTFDVLAVLLVLIFIGSPVVASFLDLPVVASSLGEPVVWTVSEVPGAVSLKLEVSK